MGAHGAKVSGGYLTQVQDGVVDGQRTAVLRQAINPLSLIEQMDRVYVVTSTMVLKRCWRANRSQSLACPGMQFEAQPMTDRPARAGCPTRAARARLTSCLPLPTFTPTRYLNPVTHQRGTIFNVIDWLVRQREMAAGLARIM
jgi:capsular polysaccharide export protein